MSTHIKVLNQRQPSISRVEVRSRAGRKVGIVGMGLMGTSIAACLLGAGNCVFCIEADPEKLRSAPERLLAVLRDARKEHLISVSPRNLLERATISDKYADLRSADIVVESTVENLAVKRSVIGKIEDNVSGRALIGCNTSAIPISNLQKGAKHPERILGLHWAEPANITRFMEIICGDQTSSLNAQKAMRFARGLGKEPSLLRKDIRGFITNRIMYAMLREAFHLVESGYATIADVDRSLRNDYGYWITFAGPFRFMDLTGIPVYATVMEDLLPDLDCTTEVPQLMRRVVQSGARGVSNSKGFYRYTPAQAKRWEELFIEFSHKIRKLAGEYPEDIGDRKSITTHSGNAG